jgi:23S rRNA (cytosine1962-C5)-methyltransferase
MIENRLRKNFQRLKGWINRDKIQACRLYDRDIPEYPFIVDLYLNTILVYDRTEESIDHPDKINHITQALRNIFPDSSNSIIIKQRRTKDPRNQDQYEKLNHTNKRITIEENGIKFAVNLNDYLDTGLFLDHRPLRYWMKKNAKGKSLLNLFSYTCSMSLCAAIGGAETTSVDMSKTYLDWGQDNFDLNSISRNGHVFINQDALEYLHQSRMDTFDIIFLDPPTFSNSKKMQVDFEVEDDQIFLIQRAMRLLRPDGVLFFSTNKRKFKLNPEVETQFRVKNITDFSIPIDFHDKKIHMCWEIRQFG